MMYFSANGWQAVLYALIAGLEAGAAMMAAGWLRRHVRRGIWMLTDALCGMGVIALFARALWQGTEGAFRLFMVPSMLAGIWLFRMGPQSLLEMALRRRRR